MKTSELIGAQLDYWVAKALGCEARDGSFISAETLDATPLGHGYYMAVDSWHPSTDWSQGGPIIERERIAIVFHRPRNDTDAGMHWDAYHHGGYTGPDGQLECAHEIAEGLTPLIAAMRAYVASKFGETVPDEEK